MRAFGPLPLTLPRSTPSSRAKRRTEGLACARAKPASSTARGAVPPRVLGAAGAAATARAAAGAAAGAGCRRGTVLAAGVRLAPACRQRLWRPLVRHPQPRRSESPCPRDTLSPTLIFNSLTTPAAAPALPSSPCRYSSVTSGSSALTVSPGLTSTSMTGTSLKSPISGTLYFD